MVQKSALKVFGDEQLNELFNKMKTSQQKSVLISAFRKASQPMVKDAKQNLLSRTRTKTSSPLYKSIGNIAHRKLPILKIGARVKGSHKGYQAHLLEEGTAERFYIHKKSGKKHYTGRIKATKFFSDAVEKNDDAVGIDVQDQIIISFTKYVMKYNAKRKT